MWVHHHALHRRRGVVAFPARGIAAVILGNNYAAAVGVKQNLGGVKAHSTRGIERPVNSVPVKLPRLHARYKDVPVVVRTVRRRVNRNHTGRARIVLPVKEHHLHA